MNFLFTSRIGVVLVFSFFVSWVSAGGTTITTDSWVQMATPKNPPSGKDSQSAVLNPINNTMVLFGGKDDTAVYNNVSLYLLESDTWAVATPTGTLPQKRYSHTAVVSAQNMMVIFGGRNETNVFNDISVYDLAANRWVSVVVSGDTPTARIGHSAVVDRVHNQMVVFGGVDLSGQYLRDLNFFDLSTYSWITKPTNGTTTARAFHSAVVSLLNIMVVFGGTTASSGLSDTACFSLNTNTWLMCSGSPSPGVRIAHTAVVSPVQMMTVFGGKDNSGTPSAEVWNFHLYNYTWTVVDPAGVAMTARYLHAAICTPFGTMTVFGGIDGSELESSDFAKYNLANATLRNANDGAVLVVLITLVGTILISLCFALDYMQEQNALEKQEAAEKAKSQLLRLLPKIPLGPKAQKFLDDFKVSLDPLSEPPK